MELELKKECLDTYELGEPQTLTQEETAETIVPDYCPDIARIISAEGVVCLHGGTEQDGVTGTVRVTVLYTPENESGVRTLEFAMPFSAQGEGLAGCAHVVVETEIELLESRMLNPRKIFTRCKLVTHLAGCRKVCLTISSDAETDPALLVEKRCCGQTVSLLRQVAEKDLTFSETMSLSLGREGAAELLHCRANGIVTETKAIGNKLIFKGVFLVSALYRTIGGQLASASAELPFSQIMETDSTEENTQVSMRLRITGTDIQIDGSDDEGRQLSVTVYYHTMAFLRETREVTLLTDLYSTAYETRYEPSQLDLCSLYESVTRRQTVREVLEIGVAAEAVLSLCADCGAVSVSREGEIAQLRTAVTVRALYLDEGGACLSAERCIDVCCPMELPKDCTVSARAFCGEEIQGTLGDRGIEVRFPVDFQVEVCGRCRKLCVASAALDESMPKDLSNAPSLILRCVGKQESAWEVAKRYNTTIADILAANQLEQESEIPCERLLLIPKKRAQEIEANPKRKSAKSPVRVSFKKESCSLLVLAANAKGLAVD